MKKEDVKEVTDIIVTEEKKPKNRLICKNITIVGLLLVIIVLLIKSYSGVAPQPVNQASQSQIQFEDSEYLEEVQKVQSDRIDIPIIGDVTVSESNPYVTLINPDSNADKFYLQYEFYLEGDEEPFYQSKMVEAGMKFSANIYENLSEAGTYKASLRVRAFGVDDLTEKNGITNNVVITVE